MSTLLCVPITVHDVDAALRDAAMARDYGADLVEYRLDDLFHGEPSADDGRDSAETRAVLGLINDSPLPCIATCRVAFEGGNYDGPEDARVSLIERLGTAFGPGEHPPRYIDFEAAAYEKSANIRQKVNLGVLHPEQARDLQTSLILSMHDFRGRPSDLTRRVLAMSGHAAAKVLKIAFMARSLRDNLEVFELLAHRDRPMIALAMGEFGLMSRVLAPKFGGFLTFASLRPTTTTAPGQPTVRELIDLYRFRSIRASTAVYGVVGHPVSHSLSPHIHNAGFEAVGHDGVYLPLPIPGGDGPGGYESIKATLLELIHSAALNLRGLSVTIPHKENVFRLAKEQGWAIDQDSRDSGAANTVLIERTARGDVSAVSIRNTDGAALLKSITDVLGSISGKSIAVLGAGGAGRAAALSCVKAGATVTIYNRGAESARTTAEQVGSNWAPLASLSPADIIINCTPVGMRDGPAPDASIVDGDLLRRWIDAGCKPCVVDTVYRPAETPLLKLAKICGLRGIDGVSMFTNQAAAQFHWWTGRQAPALLFERIVREHA